MSEQVCISKETYQELMDCRKELLIEAIDLGNHLIKVTAQRDELLAALERADDILTTEYDHVSPWVKATIARVKESL